MSSARYGRMRLGRCISLNMGIGCGADVIAVLDQVCSGKQSCKHRIIDSDFDEYHDCQKELDGFLEASFSCQESKIFPRQIKA